ncbi:MAG: polyamine ABC transporter permease [Candidatus Entotheonella gemina]|uniref:Polyamine ABC transporter permease n=1 Tax=Candidatus Entotheonella gemina TaxID=1429439 RepID=W4M7A9_9BACT|nr:MAG: polyamine ABC transporter permease [Candidatus Entotheonella gemina]
MAALPPYVGRLGRSWHYGFRILCGLILTFLMAPVLVIIPLSFNAEPYFTYPMPGFSLRWYADFMASDVWARAIQNSLIIAICTTLLSTALGTLSALGLSHPRLPYKTLIMGILISPMIVPLVITAVGMYFFYAPLGLTNNLFGIILAHTALGTPFVVITVTATLIGFDHSLTRAASSLGASPAYTFFKITMPLVLPGIISGALFAFATSFDEVVAVLFLAGVEERTIPRQMWSGMREQLSPTILAVATILVVLSVALLTTLELLRRRNERLRGIRS